MARPVVLSICLVLSLTFNSVKCESIEKSDSNIEVSVVESFDDFLAENPEVDILDPLFPEPLFEGQSARANITYRAGNRISGDSLKATDSKSYSWGSLQNLNVTLAYPANGTASIVTFIQVNVTQSSNLGRGFIVAGGIGQRFIRFVIEAKQTNFFQYKANIFGY